MHLLESAHALALARAHVCHTSKGPFLHQPQSQRFPHIQTFVRPPNVEALPRTTTRRVPLLTYQLKLQKCEWNFLVGVRLICRGFNLLYRNERGNGGKFEFRAFLSLGQLTRQLLGCVFKRVLDAHFRHTFSGDIVQLIMHQLFTFLENFSTHVNHYQTLYRYNFIH